MRHYIYILWTALSIAVVTGCSNKESIDETGQQGAEKPIPEGYFVATFSTSSTRAESDFNPATGEDERVADLRYLLYEASGKFVKERLIFDDFDGDPSDNLQDWPLPAIVDTLPIGKYRAVFITNTDPDIFRKDGANMPLPDDLLSDYKLGFDQARLNLPYLLGADDYDFFIDVIEFSHVDPTETVYLQRIVGIFKVYRSLVDAQEGLNYLVGNLVDNIKEGDIIENQVTPLLSGALGDALSPAMGLLELINLDDVVLNPLLDILVAPVVDALYVVLLDQLISTIGGLLEGNNQGKDLTDILDPLLNPWLIAEGAAVTVSNQPIQFGFDMEVKLRDPNPHTYYLPIVDAVTDGENKRVVMTKYLGFEDIDNDGVGDEMITLNSINAAIPGLVGGMLLDDVVESDYLLSGALFDIKDPLMFHAPNNLQVYNEYSVVDLGVDDYSQKGDDLTVGVTLGDVVNLNAALAGTLDMLLNKVRVPSLGWPITQTLGELLISYNINLMDIEISLPINLPLLNIDNLDVSGSWDPENTLDMPN